MKKIFSTAILVFTFSIISFSQISKSDIEQMLKELGSSMDKIEFYKDGNWKKTYSRHQKNSDKYRNKFFLKETGFLRRTYKDGKLEVLELFPFSSIVSVNVQKSYIGIEMKE
jgi:hypothetical protein